MDYGGKLDEETVGVLNSLLLTEVCLELFRLSVSKSTQMDMNCCWTFGRICHERQSKSSNPLKSNET